MMMVSSFLFLLSPWGFFNRDHRKVLNKFLFYFLNISLALEDDEVSFNRFRLSYYPFTGFQMVISIVFCMLTIDRLEFVYTIEVSRNLGNFTSIQIIPLNLEFKEVFHHLKCNRPYLTFRFLLRCATFYLFLRELLWWSGRGVVFLINSIGVKIIFFMLYSNGSQMGFCFKRRPYFKKVVNESGKIVVF